MSFRAFLGYTEMGRLTGAVENTGQPAHSELILSCLIHDGRT